MRGPKMPGNTFNYFDENMPLFLPNCLKIANERVNLKSTRDNNASWIRIVGYNHKRKEKVIEHLDLDPNLDMSVPSTESEVVGSASEETTIPLLPSVVHRDFFSDINIPYENLSAKKRKRKTKNISSLCSVCSPKEVNTKNFEVSLKIGSNYPKQRPFKNLFTLYTQEHPCLRMPLKKKTPYHLRVAPEAPLSTRLSAIAEEQLNNMEIDNPVFKWPVERVGQWISKEMNMPQYRRNFMENSISGRQLVLINAEALEQMGISIFDDIITISQSIREMFKLQREVNINLFLTKSRFDPDTLFTMYNHRTGGPPQAGVFYKKHHLALEKKPFCSLFEIKRTQWDMLPKTVKTVNKRKFVLKSFDSYPVDMKRRPSPKRLW